MRKFPSICFLIALTLAPVSAMSQVWLADRQLSEGPGVALGDSLLFHPGLVLEGGYDANPLRNSEYFTGAGRLRLAPYLDLASRAGQRRVEDAGLANSAPPQFSFRLGLAGYYDWYLSHDVSVSSQNDFGIDSHLNFILFPEGKLSLIVQGSYLRTVQPFEGSLDARSRHSFRPGLAVRLRPGGGMLAFELGYRLDLTVFEDGFLATNNDKAEHDLRFHTSWKVFPKTAIVTQTRFSPILHNHAETDKHDSLPIRSLAGLQGLVSDRFGVLMLVGYGASFYEKGDNFGSGRKTGILAQGELMFFITPFARIQIGGIRDFVDSLYANFYVKNGGYLAYSQMIGGVFLTTLKADAYYRDYGEISGSIPPLDATPSTHNREDVWIGSSLLLELRAADWLSFHVSGEYQGNISEFEYTYTDTEGKRQVQPVSFNKFEVFGGVRGHY
jgi:hypothetical protein